MNDVRWFCLPYCLQRLISGKYVVLNRQYKPIGFVTGERVEYEAYPIALKLNITAEVATAMSWNGDAGVDRIYFYNDGCVPTASPEKMQAYLQRLAVFAQLRVGMTA